MKQYIVQLSLIDSETKTALPTVFTDKITANNKTEAVDKMYDWSWVVAPHDSEEYDLFELRIDGELINTFLGSV